MLGSRRVERWRGGLGATYLFPTLSSVGASLVSPCSVSTFRSSDFFNGLLGEPMIQGIEACMQYHRPAFEQLKQDESI